MAQQQLVLQAGDLAQARDCLARAVRLLPEEVGIMNLYAATLMRQGESRLAAQALDRALQTDPTSGVAWVLSGDLHNGAGRTREARAAYERAIEIEVGGARVLVTSGFDRATLADVLAVLREARAS